MIPLAIIFHFPLDWHDFFDAYTNSISITPAGRNCIGEVGADGRFPVTVHVYFDPSSPDAPQRHTQLRSCTMVRENVFCVTVFKKEAQKFVEVLSKRHDCVVQKWSKVP